MNAILTDGRRGRALAVAITLLGLLLLWLGVVAPALDWFDERQALLTQQSAILQRMQGLATSLPELRQTAASARTASGHAASALAGTSDALAAANLQQMLDDFARKNDLRIVSTETLAAEPAGAWRAISLRVTLTAAWPKLVQLLQAIAVTPTAMVVDNLQLRSPGRDDAEQAISAAFTVTAWRQDGQKAP